MIFVDRDQELSYLKRTWDDRSAALIILYGRRRVGKSELIRVFAKDRTSIFYVATESSSADQLRSFSRAVRDGLGEEAAGVDFADWDGALEFLSVRARKKRLLVVLDEFPYLVEARRDLPSLLQRAWDVNLRDSRIMLVLCGSSISFMESELLAHRSPMYGRRTGQLLLNPLGYRESGLFFPSASAEDKVELYATLGGMPAYLLQFRREDSLWQNIRKRILERGAFLHDEVPFLLMQELREPRYYLALLMAMAEGRTRLNDIAERALGPGQSSKAGFYIQTLQDLRLVERVTPVTERNPHKSRKGIYRICDPFVRFWLRFVFGESSALGAGRASAVVEERVRPAWSDFVAPVFEDISRQFVRARMKYSVTGSWWSPKGEIDVVALDAAREKMLCGECKWSTRKVGTDVLDALSANAAILAKDQDVAEIRLALFSRRGFTESLRRRASTEDVLLYSADDLYHG